MSQKFDRLTKVNFDARMGEALKSLATKTQVENALDLGDEKIKK